MTTIATAKVNQQLRDLWIARLQANDWPPALGPARWPLQYPAREPGQPLFVGLNPSHKTVDEELLGVRNPFSEDLRDSHRVASILHREESVLGVNGKSPHPYFGKFSELVQSPLWNHVDVLAVRHTKQAELKGALGIDDEGRFPPFVDNQIDIMLTLMDVLEPPVVVVVNALAANILLYKLADQLKWNETLGTYERQTEGRATPWLMSGMLTGQRALDNHSFKRLRWHVQRVLSAAGS